MPNLEGACPGSMLVWTAKDGFLMAFLLSPIGNVKRSRVQEHHEQMKRHTQGSEAEAGAGRGLGHSGKWRKVTQLLASTLEENPERKERELSGGQSTLHYDVATLQTWNLTDE